MLSRETNATQLFRVTPKSQWLNVHIKSCSVLYALKANSVELSGRQEQLLKPECNHVCWLQQSKSELTSGPCKLEMAIARSELTEISVADLNNNRNEKTSIQTQSISYTASTKKVCFQDGTCRAATLDLWSWCPAKGFVLNTTIALW